jgi:hypothetical protein
MTRILGELSVMPMVVRHVVAISVLPGTILVLVLVLMIGGHAGWIPAGPWDGPEVSSPEVPDWPLGSSDFSGPRASRGLNLQERTRVDRADPLIGLEISPVRTPPVG